MRQIVIIATVFAMGAVGAAHADGRYAAKKDDFSNGTEHTLTFVDGNRATLFITCKDEPKSFWAQMYIEDVIYPDDVDFDRKVMKLNMTHKFDTAASAHSATWLMPVSNYHSVQYPGDDREFLAEALVAGRLAIKQDKVGETYAFMINAADHEHLRTLQKACALDRPVPVASGGSRYSSEFISLAEKIPLWQQQYDVEGTSATALNARATWKNCEILERVGEAPHTAEQRGRVLNCVMGHGFPLR